MPFTAIAQAAKAAAGGLAALSVAQATAAVTLTAGLLSAGVVSVLPHGPAVTTVQQPVASQGELAQAHDRLKSGLEATYAGRPKAETPLEAPPAETPLVAPEAREKPAPEPTVPLAVTPPEPRLWTALPPPEAGSAPADPPATPTQSPPAEAGLQDPKAPGQDGAASPSPWIPTPQPELLGKARDMLAKGDVAGARLWLEMAAERGDAEASFQLAETYDPASLAEWGVLGMTSDVARARALYARAMAGGVAAAKARIGRLDP